MKSKYLIICAGALLLNSINAADTITTNRYATQAWVTDLVEQYQKTAEAYGATNNDAFDDSAAIMNCLSANGVCYLGAGTYSLSSKITLTSNQQLIGQGREKTILRLIDNCPQYTALAPNVGAKLYPIGTLSSNQSGVLIKGLTLDCNFSGQTNGNWTNTIGGVGLTGHNHWVEDVKVIDAGIGGSSSVAMPTSYAESFCIIIDQSGSSAITNHSAIVNCEVTDPSPASGDGDMSCIVIHVEDGTGEIYNNWVHDITPESGFRAGNLHCYSAYGKEVDCHDNLAYNVYGNGFYGDTWTNRKISIRNNRFLYTQRGIWLNNESWTDCLISGNYWVNFRTVPGTWDMSRMSSGSFGEDWSALIGIHMHAGADITNLVIQNNTLKSSIWTHDGTNRTAYPCIVFSLTSNNYTNISVLNNTLDYRDVHIDNDTISWNNWFVTNNCTWDASKIHWAGNRNSYGGSANLNVLDVGSGITTTSFDETFAIPRTYKVPSAKASHGNLWVDYTNNFLFYVDPNGKLAGIGGATNWAMIYDKVSGTPGAAGGLTPWFWMPVVVDGTNAFVPLYK